jgi:hypothetical protein
VPSSHYVQQNLATEADPALRAQIRSWRASECPCSHLIGIAVPGEKVTPSARRFAHRRCYWSVAEAIADRPRRTLTTVCSCVRTELARTAI